MLTRAGLKVDLDRADVGAARPAAAGDAFAPEALVGLELRVGAGGQAAGCQ